MRIFVVYWLTALTVFAELPAEWKQVQQLKVPQPGLIKLSLPAETLNELRPELEDLRIFDPAGHEVPYVIERPVAHAAIFRAPKNFQVRIEGSATVIDIETGVTQPLDAVTLETPATSFVKAVAVAGSTDRENWQPIALGRSIFRQTTGASQLRIPIPAAVWPFLRLTVDDNRAEAIPFTGAQLYAVTGEPAPSEPLQLRVGERTESDRQTRLVLDLGANHLTLASLQFETGESLFTRPVGLAVQQVAENAITERVLARDTIYRVAIPGLDSAEHLEIQVDLTIPGRELLVLVDNGDNPPLHLNNIHVTRRPVYSVFFAQTAGTYQLATGNSRCPAPQYDLASLAEKLKGATATPLAVSPPAGNPAYRPTEALPEVQETGTPLDTAEWKYRKPVRITHAGVQQLDLDLDVLSHADASLRDLRLVHDGKQQPYILERTSIARKLTPTVSLAVDPQRPTFSRWSIKLPHANLPVTRLTCTTRSTLFRRQVLLYEDPLDERGEKYRRILGQATWVRTPPATTAPLEIAIGTTPLTDVLTLETDNGDNPAVELSNLGMFYPVIRMLFKAPIETATWLYYGNRVASYPQYDLDLIAPRLLAEEKSAASPASEESLRPSAVGEFFGLSRTRSILLWSVLGAVVVVLLVVIGRLLPKSDH